MVKKVLIQFKDSYSDAIYYNVIIDYDSIFYIVTEKTNEKKVIHRYRIDNILKVVEDYEING